jgi:diguanylate cyclase (GGDEF)-like protein
MAFHSGPLFALPAGGEGAGSPLEAPFSALHRALLVVGSLLLVALVALLDYATGPYLSFSVFYLLPVAVCAWWGGYWHGVLLAIAGSAAWNLVESLENPLMPPAAGVWNGVGRFCTMALVAGLVARLHAGALRERRLARTDALTGAANGRTFYEAVASEAGRARRASRPLTLAYLDLDDFKQLNDRLGHAAGDAALVHLVRTVYPLLRGSDLLARLGGDEFGLLLPETGADGAVTLLDRLQEVLSREMERRGWPLTLSVGALTFLHPLRDVDLMIHRVDLLMYEAKRKGKGRVEHAVLRGDEAAPDDEWNRPERRATARVLCEATVRVRPSEGEGGPEEFAKLQNISVSGIGLRLPNQYPPETVLIVESLSPDTKTLLARVVRVHPAEGGGWMHGCVLATCLSADELCDWLGRSPPRARLAEACHPAENGSDVPCSPSLS